MRRFFSPFLILLLSLSATLASPAAAVVCAVDPVPGATLLLPYFEADVAGTTVETIVSVHNAFAQPVIAQLVVWSDVGVPIFSIPISLKGFDVYTLSLRELLTTGRVSPSQPLSFSSCQGVLPRPNIPAATLKSFQDALTGKPSSLLNNRCAGLALPGRPSIAHGFITIDTVSSCTLRIPTDAGYFNGDATFQNALWGTSFFVDSGAFIVHTEPMVALEASPTAFKPGDYTFYGRLLRWTAADGREPLATDFGVRFYSSVTATRTDLFVWRDIGWPQGTFSCGSKPTPGYPAGQRRLTVFNEESVGSVAASGIRPFGTMAQRVTVNGPQLSTPVRDFGWLFLNLNQTQPTAADAPGQPTVAQAWVVGLVRSATTPTYASGYEAMHYDSACRGKAQPGLKLP